MRSASLTIIALLFSISVAQAQTSTAVGTGIGVSRSSSTSRATAIGGGQGIGTGGTATSTVTVGGTPAVTTTNTTTNDTLRNVPSVFAPGLTSAGLETCLGSVSVGASWLGTGLTGGGTIPDPGCAARLDARTLWAFGLKKAAVARLCLQPDIYNSMPEVCVRYLPQVRAGYVASTPILVGTAAASAPAEKYAGGPIELIDGKTHQVRMCNDYDASRYRCRVWAR